MTGAPPASLTLSSQDLDALCVPLLAHVKMLRLATDDEIRDATPQDFTDVYEWLRYYGRLCAWIAKPKAEDQTQADADGLVMDALREASIAVEGVPELRVYPKSLETLLQIKVLDRQVDRLTGGLLSLTGDGATLAGIDAAVPLAEALSYCVNLCAWTWTTEGPGLPFKATDPAPVVPEHIAALGPIELLAITHAAHRFGASLAACQQLIDPVPTRDNGKRPSWAAFFEAVGAATNTDPRELAVTTSFASVLARAYLAGDRLRPRSDGADA